MKKALLLLTILHAITLNGVGTNESEKIHRDLLGKIQKLPGDREIYVGAGTSSAGEPIFFAMEKLNDKSMQIWQKYADALYKVPGVLRDLKYSNIHCKNAKIREDLKEKMGSYIIELMDTMCPNQQKLKTTFGDDGIASGINGFNEKLARQRDGSPVYVVYASSKPVAGPFVPKTELGRTPTIEEFDRAYPDIIMSMCVDVGFAVPTSEHRGIFKNPFAEIRGEYKNISMLLHDYAASVEEQFLHKSYVAIFPNPIAAELLQRWVKPGDMYIGTEKCPVPLEDELRKKYPPIKDELIGITTCPSRGPIESMHIFETKVLSKRYAK